MQREFPQHLLPFGSQREQHFTPVLASALPPDIPAGRQPIHQLHCTVVLDLQTLGQFPDPRPHALGQSFERQHQLMLPWLQRGSPGSLLAKVEKAANLVAQFRQRLVIRQRELGCHAADYIVPRP